MPTRQRPEMNDEEEIVTVALDPRAWIGVTVLISFALTIAATLIYLISGGGTELFQRRVLLRTYFADGTGLERKAVVEVDGIKVGLIDSVELSHSGEPSRIVRVNVAIATRYLSSIPVDSKTEITADNLLGDKYINIHKGHASEFVKEGDELLAQPPDKSFDPADLIHSLQDVLKRTNALLDLADDPNSQLGQLFQSDEIYNKIRDDLMGIQTIIHTAVNPKSPAGQAIFGSELYDQLRAPVLQIDKQLAAIENGEGDLGHAYASTDQYDQLRRGIAGFHKSVAELKSNELLTGDEMHDRLAETFKQLDTIISSLTAGPLFENAAPYESLVGQTKSAGDLLREFRNNPKKFLRIKVF